MNHLFIRTALAALAVSNLSLTSCNTDDDQPEETVAPALETKTVSNLAPQPAAPTSTGQPGTPRHYTFFSLAEGKEVPYTDSASAKWDLAFRATTVLINGGTSGPGQGGAQVKSGLFNELTTAPADGYAVDGTAKAIPTGSGNGWYTYNPTTHVVSPIAGKILCIRTATGKYAKLEISSYYRGAPAAPTGTEPSAYYSFRYVYQPDGSKNLK